MNDSPPDITTSLTVPPSDVLDAGQLSLFELAEVANQEHAAAVQSLEDALEHFISAGAALNAARDKKTDGEWRVTGCECGDHKGFTGWLVHNFEASQRTAYRYMTVCTAWQSGDLDEAKSLRDAEKAMVKLPPEKPEEPEPLPLEAVDPAGFNGFVADVWDIPNLMPAESVDVIITDPPYPLDLIDTWSGLSAAAAHVLKPGGAVIAMSGQMHLPEVMARLGEHLDYWWMAALLTPGQSTRVGFVRKVHPNWKPLLVYTKGEFGGDSFGDVAKSDANDKEHHHWGQSESAMADMIRRWSRPGDHILDPFCGGGTTAVVALQLGRTVTTCDIDAEWLDVTRRRLAGE